MGGRSGEPENDGLGVLERGRQTTRVRELRRVICDTDRVPAVCPNAACDLLVFRHHESPGSPGYFFLAARPSFDAPRRTPSSPLCGDEAGHRPGVLGPPRSGGARIPRGAWNDVTSSWALLSSWALPFSAPPSWTHPSWAGPSSALPSSGPGSSPPSG